MDESLRGAQWLRDTARANATVQANATGGVWIIQAPQGAVPPFVVITPMAAHDVLNSSGLRLWTEAAYQVRVWTLAAQSDTATTIDDALDTLFARTSGSTSDAVIMACWRDNPLPPLPDWNGQELRIGVGGLYRLQIRPA